MAFYGIINHLQTLARAHTMSDVLVLRAWLLKGPPERTPDEICEEIALLPASSNGPAAEGSGRTMISCFGTPAASSLSFRRSSAVEGGTVAASPATPGAGAGSRVRQFAYLLGKRAQWNAAAAFTSLSEDAAASCALLKGPGRRKSRFRAMAPAGRVQLNTARNPSAAPVDCPFRIRRSPQTPEAAALALCMASRI